MISKITMNHGSGGREMHEFLSNYIEKKLGNPILSKFDDAAVLEGNPNKKMAMTTDSFVVDPLFFPGGDIGTLAVCGTVNDLATSGAKPHALSLSFILEEGVEIKTLERIIDSIAETARKADVKIVTGDTKVVQRGKGDQIYINTCAVGFIEEGVNLSTYNAKEGDSVFLTGAMGNHEIALVSARKMIDFDIDVVSDAAPLNRGVEQLLSLTKEIRTIKDPTRGGVASALHEICDHSNVEITLNETALPIDDQVKGVCELVGFDPLYLSNEGKYLIIAPKNSEEAIKKAFPNSVEIGKVTGMEKPRLLLETSSGGIRRLGMLETTQLPRIC